MDTIVQFECFETELQREDFIIQWSPLAKALVDNNSDIRLHERSGGNNKFRYISKHEWPESNFSFRFMKGRNSDFFNEHLVKITQAGGYMPLQVEYQDGISQGYDKIILLLPITQQDVEPFKKLSFHRYLNIYQSYFESCLYSYILEFFVPEKQREDFLHWLSLNKYLQDAGIYKACTWSSEMVS